MPRDRSKARELQERGKTSGVDELQMRLQKESEELKKSRLETKSKIESIKARKKSERIAQQMKEVPILYMGAFIPCIFAVITICMNSVETGVRVPQQSQCLALWTYLVMSLILAYVFLFGLSMMFIGSQMELPTPVEGWTCLIAGAERWNLSRNFMRHFHRTSTYKAYTYAQAACVDDVLPCTTFPPFNSVSSTDHCLYWWFLG